MASWISDKVYHKTVGRREELICRRTRRGSRATNIECHVMDRVCGSPAAPSGFSLRAKSPSLPFRWLLFFLLSLSSSPPLPLPSFYPPSRPPGASLARPLLSTRTIAMSAYPRMDPYRGSRYEHGIDAKVVVMGNSGEPVLHLLPSNHCLL